MLLPLCRWLADRTLVVAADRADAGLDLLARCQRPLRLVTMVTRLRLDAALDDAPPERTAEMKDRSRKKGQRQPTLQTRLSDLQSVLHHEEISTATRLHSALGDQPPDEFEQAIERVRPHSVLVD